MADTRVLYTLLESAAGYALFHVVAFEEISSHGDNASGQLSVTDLARFSRAVKLQAFVPFESAAIALENANAISEHAMTPTLANFLETHLPNNGELGGESAKKKKKKSSSGSRTEVFALGVIDPALGTAIQDGLDGVTCRSDDTIREILRGCRLHLVHYVKGLSATTTSSTGVVGPSGIVQAQLGLGHAYSRSKVKFNPARSDNMVIQAIALLDQLDKDINTFTMRIREWYSWHFPELRTLVKDNIMYARAAAYIQNRQTLVATSQSSGDDATGAADKLAGLTEIVGDEAIAEGIVAAAKTTMGMDCSTFDMLNIVNFTQRIVKLAEYRKQLTQYLTDKLDVVAPNLSSLIGDSVAARLISKAGSLTNLAKAPASTVQILGAEKALFRALKTKGNTPKYGLIYHSTFIGRADTKNKGRISRYLANKCAIAARIDSFSDAPNRRYGEKLKEQVEERLKFYETGAAPRKNIDVMNEVSRELKAGMADMDDDDAMEVEKKEKKVKKDKKDKKKRKADNDSDGEEADSPSKKKSKKEKKDKKKKKE